MSAQDNGGPAFPIIHPPVEGFTTGGVEYYGLTLRDYFAAKAMAAILGSSKLKDDFERDGVAGDAYDMADAMLEARQK